MISIDDKTDWCLSGGARGADLAWGTAAAEIGHGVLHFSFAGHRSPVSDQKTIVALSETQLQIADEMCHRANRTLQRRFPTQSSFVDNLLRRDWYQVSPAQACYAVSSLGLPPDLSILPLGTIVQGRVEGGTAWAVQMFIDRHDGQECPCFVFDQMACHWFQWHGDGWRSIYQPARPRGVYTGIGKRDLLPPGRLAITVLMHGD